MKKPLLKKPSAIIFDIDDTLVDTTPSYRGAIIETVQFFGGRCSNSDISQIKAAGNANNDWIVTCNILAKQKIIISLDEVTLKFEEFYQGTEQLSGLKFREVLLVNPGLLENLAKQYPLGIVTGRPSKDALWFLKYHNKEALFNVVVTMDDAPQKPSGIPVEMAAQKLGVDVKTCWMIGDTPDDIMSAVSAGAIAIGVIGPDDEPVSSRTALQNAGAAAVWNNINDIEEALR